MAQNLAELKRAVALRPTDAAARVALAEGLLGEGDRTGAITQLEKAVALDGQSWPARRLLARAFSLDRRLADAHELLTATVRLWPELAEARDELIELYLAAERLDDALIQARELTRLQPGEARRWHLLGMMLARHLLYRPAVEALEKAVALAPGDAALRADLELVSRELGQIEGTEFSDDVARPEELLAPLALTGALAQSARLLAARDAAGAKRALVLAPPDLRTQAGFFALKAEIAWDQGDRAAAADAWRKALAIDPERPGGWRRLGDVALVERRYDEAQASYQRALKLDASDLPLRALLQRVEKQARATPAGDAHRGRLGMLAWTPVGGTVSPLQAEMVAGSGEVTVSGNVGEDLQESAVLAHAFLRQRATALGVEGRLAEKDLLFHDPHTDTRKQGRSAGLAFALAAVSAARDEPLPEKLAATGEITLLGDVIPVAGIHEKVIAASLLDYRTVVMPRRNLPDARHLPPEVTSRVKLVFVDSVLEACRLFFALPGGKS